MTHHFRSTIWFGNVLTSLSSISAVIRITFSDYAKIRFKLDYFPPIINIPLYPISRLACP